MKLNLPENIRYFRKEKHLTQDQLAEALGVTVGAVSKWESGATTPELNMLVDIAAFFDLSVDALLGYRIENSTLPELLDQIQRHRERGELNESLRLCNLGLQKFPNQFDMAYQAALTWFEHGAAQDDDPTLARSQDLFRLALTLIHQNKNPEINEWLLKNQLAESYLHRNMPEQCLQIYRENNPGGVNNSRIAQLLSDVMRRHDEALPYTKLAFRRMTEDMISTVAALSSAYYRKKEYDQSFAVMEWLLAALEGLRPEDGFCETDMILCNLIHSLGEAYYGAGNREAAKATLLRAYRLAKAYDAFPREKLVVCRFFEGRAEGPYLYKNLAPDAGTLLARRRIWLVEEFGPDFDALWNEITKELEEEA